MQYTCPPSALLQAVGAIRPNYFYHIFFQITPLRPQHTVGKEKYFKILYHSGTPRAPSFSSMSCRLPQKTGEVCPGITPYPRKPQFHYCIVIPDLRAATGEKLRALGAPCLLFHDKNKKQFSSFFFLFFLCSEEWQGNFHLWNEYIP